MSGRFIFLISVCVFAAHSLPVSKTTSDVSLADIVNQIESIVQIHSSQSRSSLTTSQVESILNQIEGIINIHSAQSISDTGVINWPVVDYVIEKVEGILSSLKLGRSSLTTSQVDNILYILNEIEGIVNIHSIQSRSSLTESQVDSIINILNQIEGIINIHSARSISDTGVINWPVIMDVVGKIEGVITGLQSRSSLTQAQIDNIASILNAIEGIINIHNIQTRNVVNVDGFLDVVNQILGSSTTRSSLTQTQIDNIISIMNQIEGIINIHSIQTRGVINIQGFLDVINQILGSSSTRSSLTQAQIDNIISIANQIEGIINIHSLEAPKQSRDVDSAQVEAAVKIDSIVETLKSRSTLSSSQVDNILTILNEIEGIVNIHSSQLNARSSLTPTQVDNILNLLNAIEGIINIHSSVEDRSTTSLIDVLNAIESVIQIH